MIPVTQLKVGDKIEVEGWMLHEDLSGAKFEIIITELEAEDGKIIVHHQTLDGNESKTWFEASEAVRLMHRAS
jgi:hypothetical protein